MKKELEMFTFERKKSFSTGMNMFFQYIKSILRMILFLASISKIFREYCLLLIQREHFLNVRLSKWDPSKQPSWNMLPHVWRSKFLIREQFKQLLFCPLVKPQKERPISIGRLGQLISNDPSSYEITWLPFYEFLFHITHRLFKYLFGLYHEKSTMS